MAGHENTTVIQALPTDPKDSNDGTTLLFSSRAGRRVKAGESTPRPCHTEGPSQPLRTCMPIPYKMAVGGYRIGVPIYATCRQTLGITEYGMMDRYLSGMRSAFNIKTRCDTQQVTLLSCSHTLLPVQPSHGLFASHELCHGGVMGNGVRLSPALTPHLCKPIQACFHHELIVPLCIVHAEDSLSVSLTLRLWLGLLAVLELFLSTHHTVSVAHPHEYLLCHVFPQGRRYYSPESWERRVHNKC